MTEKTSSIIGVVAAIGSLIAFILVFTGFESATLFSTKGLLLLAATILFAMIAAFTKLREVHAHIELRKGLHKHNH